LNPNLITACAAIVHFKELLLIARDIGYNRVQTLSHPLL